MISVPSESPAGSSGPISRCTGVPPGAAGGKGFWARFVGMEKFAEPVERQVEGIPAHWKHGVTNAFMEGLNRVFRP